MKQLWKLTAVVALIGVAACGEAAETDETLDWEENQLMRDTLSDEATVADTAAAEPVTVMLTEWNVRLASDTVPAGPTRIRVRNMGEVPHALLIEGQGTQAETEVMPPGEWSTLELDLEPGTYEVVCPLDTDRGDHSEQGMRAFLVAR